MGTRPLVATLSEIRHGSLLEEAAEELQAVVKAAEETGKAATLTIQLTVKPASKAGGVMVLQDKITTKLPQLPAGETMVFVTPEFNIQAQDPRQADLPLKVVDTSAQVELKKVG